MPLKLLSYIYKYEKFVFIITINKLVYEFWNFWKDMVFFSKFCGLNCATYHVLYLLLLKYYILDCIILRNFMQFSYKKHNCVCVCVCDSTIKLKITFRKKGFLNQCKTFLSLEKKFIFPET